jgi:hypothetical protein
MDEKMTPSFSFILFDSVWASLLLLFQIDFRTTVSEFLQSVKVEMPEPVSSGIIEF